LKKDAINQSIKTVRIPNLGVLRNRIAWQEKETGTVYWRFNKRLISTYFLLIYLFNKKKNEYKIKEKRLQIETINNGLISSLMGV